MNDGQSKIPRPRLFQGAPENQQVHLCSGCPNISFATTTRRAEGVWFGQDEQAEYNRDDGKREAAMRRQGDAVTRRRGEKTK